MNWFGEFSRYLSRLNRRKSIVDVEELRNAEIAAVVTNKRRKSYTDDQIKDKLYHMEGLTAKEVSKIFGTNEDRILRLRQELGYGEPN